MKEFENLKRFADWEVAFSKNLDLKVWEKN